MTQLKSFLFSLIVLTSFNLFAQNVVETATVTRIDGQKSAPVEVERLDDGTLRLKRVDSWLPKAWATDTFLRTKIADGKIEHILVRDDRLFAVVEAAGQRTLHEFRLTRQHRMRNFFVAGFAGGVALVAALPISYTVGEFFLQNQDLIHQANREFSQMFLGLDTGVMVIAGATCARILQGFGTPRQDTLNTRVPYDGGFLRFRSLEQDPASGQITDIVFETAAGQIGRISELAK